MFNLEEKVREWAEKWMVDYRFTSYVDGSSLARVATFEKTLHMNTLRSLEEITERKIYSIDLDTNSLEIWLEMA